MSATDTRTASYSTPLEWLNEHGLDACELDDRTPMHEKLAKIPPSVRRREAICIAIQAELERLEGRVDTAVALYERALTLQMDAAVEVRIRENLASLYLNRRQDVEGERILAKARELSRDDPCVASVEIVLRARRRDARVLDDLNAIASSVPRLSDIEQARVWRRLASAIYEISGDSSASERYLNLVIERAEVAGAHCHAAVAYWALEYLYSNHVEDYNRALHYNVLAAEAAQKAGDNGVLSTLLIWRQGIATERGDIALIAELKEALSKSLGPERYAERIVAVFAEAICYGWSKAFETMRQYLLSVNIGRLISCQTPLYHALLAVAHAGSGYEKEALKGAHRAISLARPLAKEPHGETRTRLIARLLSAGVLLSSGKRTEAVRSLKGFEERMTLSLRCLRDAILERQYGAVRERAPDLYGYAMLFEALEGSQRGQVENSCSQLTQREIDILRAASRGGTSRAIAEEMSIGLRTVEWHRNNALKKLGVKTTIAAIAKARELHIIP